VAVGGNVSRLSGAGFEVSAYGFSAVTATAASASASAAAGVSTRPGASWLGEWFDGQAASGQPGGNAGWGGSQAELPRPSGGPDQAWRAMPAARHDAPQAPRQRQDGPPAESKLPLAGSTLPLAESAAGPALPGEWDWRIDLAWVSAGIGDEAGSASFLDAFYLSLGRDGAEAG
jgi:hypothetical protein